MLPRLLLLLALVSAQTPQPPIPGAALGFYHQVVSNRLTEAAEAYQATLRLARGTPLCEYDGGVQAWLDMHAARAGHVLERHGNCRVRQHAEAERSVDRRPFACLRGQNSLVSFLRRLAGSCPVEALAPKMA